MQTSRVEAFSDGVFAIAITLLILSVGIDKAPHGDLGTYLVDLWPAYLAYGVSFLTIGIMWVNHHLLFDNFARVDRPMLLLNILLLMLIAFVPFPTRVAAQFARSEVDRRDAALLYGLTMTITAILFFALWMYGSRRLLRPDADPRVVSGITRAERAAFEARPARTMRGLFLYFLRLGSLGFGGPIALAGYMRRDLVEARGWYSEDEYQQGLAIAQTMPGPLAAQLAMWLGYLQRGARGALGVALPFVVPPFLLVTAVAALYAHYQGLSQVESVFFGVGPAVMAIIAIAAYKLARSTNKRDPILWTVAAI